MRQFHAGYAEGQRAAGENSLRPSASLPSLREIKKTCNITVTGLALNNPVNYNF